MQGDDSRLASESQCAITTGRDAICRATNHNSRLDTSEASVLRAVSSAAVTNRDKTQTPHLALRGAAFLFGEAPHPAGLVPSGWAGLGNTSTLRGASTLLLAPSPSRVFRRKSPVSRRDSRGATTRSAASGPGRACRPRFLGLTSRSSDGPAGSETVRRPRHRPRPPANGPPPSAHDLGRPALRLGRRRSCARDVTVSAAWSSQVSRRWVDLSGDASAGADSTFSQRQSPRTRRAVGAAAGAAARSVSPRRPGRRSSPPDPFRPRAPRTRRGHPRPGS